MMLNFNGKCFVTQKHLSRRKALFALKSKASHLQLSQKSVLQLFDTYVISVANYACKIWGTHKGTPGSL